MYPSNYPIEKHKKIVSKSIKRIFRSKKMPLNIAAILSIILLIISNIIFLVNIGEISLYILLFSITFLLLFIFLTYNQNSKEKNTKYSIYILEDRYFCFKEMIKEVNTEILEKELNIAKEFIDIKLSEKSLSLKSLMPISINASISYILSILLAITSILASDNPDFSTIKTLIHSTIIVSNVYLYAILLTNLFYTSRRDRYAEMNYFLMRYNHGDT